MLTPQEATELFEIVRSLQADGKSIIFISHKLNEVLEIADRITVLRRGKKIETVPREGATEESLARAMVGREVLLRVEKPPAQPGERAARGRRTCTSFDDRGIEKVRGVSFAVRAGEIVGIAGVDGNGQTRADRRDRRPAQARRAARSRSPAATLAHATRARDARRRRRPHPRGPAAPRARARVLDRREHRAARLREAARREVGLALPAAARRARADADPGVRRARRRPADARRRRSRAATSRRSSPRARSRATRRC